MSLRTCLLSLIAALAIVAPPVPAQGIDLRLGDRLTEQPAIVDLVHAGDGSGRLFLVQQDGRVHVFANGQLRSTPLLDLRGRLAGGGEQGLLSIVFAPGFPSPPHLFAWYVDAADRATVLARLDVDVSTMTANVDSAIEVLRIAQPFENHNGGKLLFGPDGMLYLSTGDGGGSGDPTRTAQDLSSLLGKILRIDVRTLPYTVPADNPFVGEAGARAEIWSYGLRNPWRMSFDRSTGELWIADVGQARREEINVQPAGVGGQNWGWSCLEGTLEFASGDSCRGAAPTAPIAEYGRADGCSITGGFVYRGSRHPALRGVYLAGDFCTGRIFGLRRGNDGFGLQLLLDSPLGISSFGEDEAGELYVASYFGGVYALVDGEPEASVDPRHVGSQYWISGVGAVSGRTVVAELDSATGTRFGSAFDAAQIVRRRWGRLEIEFGDCDRGQLRWQSSGADSAGFGNGGYAVQRIAASPASQRCNSSGFAAATDLEWITGTWFGGAARSGEGVFLERLADGSVVVAFFTHRPPGFD